MQLTSPAFEPNQQIPARYTCDEENEHPPLVIADVPEGTQSFALILHDPDAVSGDFVHWFLWNIPPDTRELTPGLIPEGTIEGRNDFGVSGYGGPCPPPGTGIHRYIFELSALDITIDLPTVASRDDLLKAMEEHELARAELIGLYERGAE